MGSGSTERTSGPAERGSATARDRDRARLEELIVPVVTGAGFDLESLVITAAGRRSQVRVIIDGDDGVSLDDIALVSKSVSALLDEQDSLMGSSPYTLEVTSPGVDRVLTEPRHWRRATGRLVRYTVDGRTAEGRVLEVDETGVLLDLGKTEERLPIAGLTHAKVQVEFSRPKDKLVSGEQPERTNAPKKAKNKRTAAEDPAADENDREH